MILMAYRHGLRVGELLSLKWQQINLNLGTIQINRLKNPEYKILNADDFQGAVQIPDG